MTLDFADIRLAANRLSGRRSFDHGVTWEFFDVPVRHAWIVTAFASDEDIAREIWRHQDAMEGLSPSEGEWDPRLLTESSERARQCMFAVAAARMPPMTLADEWGLSPDIVLEWMHANRHG